MKIYREVGSLCIVNRKDAEGYERPVYEIEVDEAEKYGEWKKLDVAEYRCMNCGKIQYADDVNELNYCCNCGSRNKVRNVR